MSILHLVASAYCSIQIVKFVLALYYLKIFSKSKSPKIATAVDKYTIMQAIMAGDPTLGEMLDRNLREHPEAQFLWLLDQDDSEAREIAEGLRSKYNKSNITIVHVRPCPDGINPKLFKFQQAHQQIQFGHVIILDDDTFLPRKTARYLVAGLHQYGLVTGLPCYLDGPNLSSKLLAQFVNNNAAMTYLPLAPFLPPVTINGMCYALKLKTIRQLNLFRPLLGHLTDDLAVSDAVKKLGLRIQQIPMHQFIQTSLAGPVAYIRQMHRWFFFAVMLLRKESLLMNALIFILQGLPPFLLLATIVISLMQANLLALSLLLIVLLLRTLLILVLQYRLSKQYHHRVLLSLVSEILQPVHLLHALVWNRIVWRRRHYKVLANDQFKNVA